MSSATIDVPWDVISDILSRLPVKALLRFRSVAKSFCALPDDPYFISRHLHRSSKNGSRLLVQSNLSIDSGHSFSLLSLKTFDFAGDPHFIFPYSDSTVLVVGSCNGVVCLICDQGPSILLWNPSIREHKILPPPLLPYSLRFIGYKNNFNSIGFGFHNGEYKVVRLATESIFESDLAKIEIYSTRSNSWREIDLTVPRKIYYLTCSVIVKGSPYWKAHESDSDEDRDCIVSFDMANEVFRTINLPSPNTDISGSLCGVGTVSDQLAFYFNLDYYDGGDELCCVEIWTMNGENSEERWAKLFTLRNFPVPGWPFGLYGDGSFMWMKSDGYLFVTSPSPRDLLVYSPHTTNELTRVECLRNLANLKAYTHLESLVRIHGGGDEDMKEANLA